MAFLILLLFAAGIAGVTAGGVVLIETVSFATGCVDECHGSVFGGAVGMLLILMGLLTLMVAVALLSQREARSRTIRNRRLNEVRARLFGEV